MKQLAAVLLICFFLVSSSRSMEDVMSTLKAENSSITTPTPSSTSSLSSTSTTTTNAAKMEDASTTLNPEEHKPKQLPVDLLSPDKFLLDPNVVLARLARDTYGGWGQKQSFGSPYERRPFGIEGYYNRPNGYYRPEPPRRRNSQVRRFEPASKPFRVYPVFPG